MLYKIEGLKEWKAVLESSGDLTVLLNFKKKDNHMWLDRDVADQNYDICVSRH